MVIGVILVNGEAMLAYKSLPGTKDFKKAVHLTLQLVSFILSWIGVWAAWKYHNDMGIENFYSLHSWMGLACLFLFFIQGVAGFTTFWFPGGSTNSRLFLLPWHVFFGIFIYGMALATAAAGILEKSTFLQARKVISRYSSEAILLNFMGLMIIMLGAFVILGVLTPSNAKADIVVRSSG